MLRGEAFWKHCEKRRKCWHLFPSLLPPQKRQDLLLQQKYMCCLLTRKSLEFYHLFTFGSYSYSKNWKKNCCKSNLFRIHRISDRTRNCYSMWLKPFRNKPWFIPVYSTSLFKTLLVKEKLLLASNFSFSHSFLAVWRYFWHFHQILSAESFSLEESKICHLGKS